jgi:hypothetical protein
MRRLVVAMIVAVATGLGDIESASAAGPALTAGIGGLSCGTWTRQRGQGGVQADIDREWILGFVTGVNWDRATNPNARGSLLGQGIDVKAWFGFVDSYCQAHPFDTVLQAAINLIRELERPATE